MTAGAKATLETEGVHTEDSAEETETQMVGLVKQSKGSWYDDCSEGNSRSISSS